MLLWTVSNMHSAVHSQQFLQSIYLGGKLLSQGLCLSPTIWDDTELLPKWLTSLHSHPQCIRVPVLHILLNTWYDQIFYLLQNRREFSHFSLVQNLHFPNKLDFPYFRVLIGHSDLCVGNIFTQTLEKIVFSVFFFLMLSSLNIVFT